MENRAIIEALSWRLATETVRRAPDRLRIYEMHPGGGQYDCLALFTDKGETVAFLNRGGTFTPFSTWEGTPTTSDSWDVWKEVGEGLGSKRLVDGICERIALPVPPRLPPSTPRVLAYRFITEFLAWTVFHSASWECRNGFQDNSGGWLALQEKYFTAFPKADQRMRESEESDLNETPAYRFWFILRDGEPVLCLETIGTVWDLKGNSINLPTAYAGPRRIWPLIFEIAGGLLP